MKKIIVKNGNLVYEGKPGRGGHIMYVLQWIECLRRLGYEVLYYDTLVEGNTNAAMLFQEIMERWWSPSLSALLLQNGDALYGLSGKQIKNFSKEASAVISLSSTYNQESDEWIANVHPKILIEQDPAFTHIWASNRNPHEIFGEHDFYFTVGGNVGTEDCTIPTCGINWKPIVNPVILDWWNNDNFMSNACFTTVASLWVHEYQEFEGKLWGPKAEQIRLFADVPAQVTNCFEIVLDCDPDDPEIGFLQNKGWKVLKPEIATADPKSYIRFIKGSYGEFSCAKGLYVGSKSGWFSDRSACYLAAGKPVVVQDTGFQQLLPTGEGLFAFSTLQEATEAIGRINNDYSRHARAARQLAENFFDANKVIPSLLKEAGI